MLGMYGFYEAVDLTPARLAVGQEIAIVQSYMAHHQGMIMLSLVNYLQGDTMVRRFQRDPRIQSVGLLLLEQIPRDAPIEQTNTEVSPGLRVATSPQSYQSLASGSTGTRSPGCTTSRMVTTAS